MWQGGPPKPSAPQVQLPHPSPCVETCTPIMIFGPANPQIPRGNILTLERDGRAVGHPHCLHCAAGGQEAAEVHVSEPAGGCREADQALAPNGQAGHALFVPGVAAVQAQALQVWHLDGDGSESQVADARVVLRGEQARKGGERREGGVSDDGALGTEGHASPCDYPLRSGGSGGPSGDSPRELRAHRRPAAPEPDGTPGPRWTMQHATPSQSKDSTSSVDGHRRF